MTSKPEPDERLVGAHDLALHALREITPASSIGPAAGYLVEDDGTVSLRFENRLAGYPGWFWIVTVARVDGDEPTVLEAELLPGDGALLAPEWVPWAERLAEYRAHQAELAEQSAAASAAGDAGSDAGDGAEEDDEDADDDLDDETDDVEDDLDDEDDEDDEMDGVVSPRLHAGDLDGVDIDELDDSVESDEDESDADDADEDDADADESDEDESDINDADDDDEDESDIDDADDDDADESAAEGDHSEEE